MSYRLLLLKVSEEWARKLSEELAQCPRVFFLSRLRGNKLAIGMYAEDSETMEAQTECFKKVVDIESLDIYEIEEFVMPEWEFEVLDKEKEQTYCQIIKCSDCPMYTRCLGCPGTIWYTGEKTRDQFILQDLF
ncbi:MAG: hypothetical protein R6U44_08900 [Archaeoglobaceae archaeon]